VAPLGDRGAYDVGKDFDPSVPLRNVVEDVCVLGKGLDVPNGDTGDLGKAVTDGFEDTEDFFLRTAFGVVYDTVDLPVLFDGTVGFFDGNTTKVELL
jgi:hypothetical protein